MRNEGTFKGRAASNLHNFDFLLASCGSEERRTTTRGLDTIQDSHGHTSGYNTKVFPKQGFNLLKIYSKFVQHLLVTKN